MSDYYDPENQKNARKSHWYDEVTRNLTKCPFCDLKDKYLISEKDGMVLTVNLFPYIDGHLMVIPRKHVENFETLSSEEWAAAQELLKLGIKLLKSELGCENTNTLYREGAKSGMSLKHMHIHLLPITPEFLRYEGEHKRFIMEFQDVNLAPIEMAKKLRNACKKLQSNK